MTAMDVAVKLLKMSVEEEDDKKMPKKKGGRRMLQKRSEILIRRKNLILFWSFGVEGMLFPGK